MKKILFVFGLTVMFGANLIISNSSSNNINDLFNLQNIAYADGEPGDLEFACYNAMIYHGGARTLECNVPCCFRNDFRPNAISENDCSGPFSDCS